MNRRRALLASRWSVSAVALLSTAHAAGGAEPAAPHPPGGLLVMLSVLVVVLGGLTVWRKGRLGGFLCALGCVMAFLSMVVFYNAQTNLADLNAVITALAGAILFGLGLVIHWLSKISAQLEGTSPRAETRRPDGSL